MYQLLTSIYGKECVFRNYIDSRYPFHCDFYISNIDTFIELNIHWTHGGHWYNPSNKNDIDMLCEWQNKQQTKPSYKTAIETWSIRDVHKKNIAEQNHINYIVLWNRKDIENFELKLLSNKGDRLNEDL